MDTAVGNLANFITIKLLPFLVIESLEEFINVYGVNEIDKGIAHVAPIFEVNREIEEIILIFGLSINCLKQHFLGILIRDVSDHD